MSTPWSALHRQAEGKWGANVGIFDTGASEARQLNQKNMDFIKSIFGNLNDQQANSLFGILNQQFSKGTPLMEQAVGEVRGGFDKALATASNFGSGERSGILAREKQRLGNARGRLAGSGLYSSTGAINAERGIGADTDRALLNVTGQQSGLMSGLQSQQGMAVGGALSNLANYLASKAQLAGGMGGNLASILSQFQFQAGGSQFSQFAGLAGTVIGGMYGGPMGAAAGSQLGNAVE